METIYRKFIQFFETICNSYRSYNPDRDAFISRFCNLCPKDSRKSMSLVTRLEWGPWTSRYILWSVAPGGIIFPRPRSIFGPLLTALPPNQRTRQIKKTNSFKWRLFRYPLRPEQIAIFLFRYNKTLNILYIFLCFAMFNHLVKY